MKRILFVDDEPKVLDGLQRMLRSQRHEWEMAFANSADLALIMMEAAPFDVIVTDMRMPGVDGATLLGRVREKFPGIVRIVLSGYIEHQAAFRAIPVAHQFLRKPCDPDRLRVAVERACNLRAVLVNDMVRRAVGSMGELPALPSTYAALSQALNDPDVALDRVAKIVEQDVGISAKVLQLVNSAFFGLVHDIASVKTAVSYIGIDLLRHLVLSVEVFGVFRPRSSIDGFSLEEMQKHANLTTAIAARLPVPKHLTEATLVAALLHDVGRLVLAARMPDQLARALRLSVAANVPFHSAEQEVLGVTHAEIGAYLMGLWGLPVPIVEAVAHHHAPERVPAQGFDTLAAIYVANLLAHEVAPADYSRPHPPMDLGYLKALGVEKQLPAWRVMAAETAHLHEDE